MRPATTCPWRTCYGPCACMQTRMVWHKSAWHESKKKSNYGSMDVPRFHCFAMKTVRRLPCLSSCQHTVRGVARRLGGRGSARPRAARPARGGARACPRGRPPSPSAAGPSSSGTQPTPPASALDPPAPHSPPPRRAAVQQRDTSTAEGR